MLGCVCLIVNIGICLSVFVFDFEGWVFVYVFEGVCLFDCSCLRGCVLDYWCV